MYAAGPAAAGGDRHFEAGEIGAAIHVRDVTISDKVKILDDPAETIVVATATREEKVVEEAPAEEEAAPEESETSKKE